MLLTYSKDIFVDMVKTGLKIHSLRPDPKNRWKPGRSIQHWRGNPRNIHCKNKPYHFLDGECKGVQEVSIVRDPNREFEMAIVIDGWNLPDEYIQHLATNDGLGVAAFRMWFVPPKSPIWTGRIIHFTDFKYCK